MKKIKQTETEAWFEGTPEELGKLPLRKEMLVERKVSEKPTGFFFGEWINEEQEYCRCDQIHERPDTDPLKIAYTKYEQEQIEKTKRNDWWNHGIDEEQR